MEENITNEFAALGLDASIVKAVEAKGFLAPTAIQRLAIPRLLNGEANIIARARTGTGKTAAFCLPIIQKLQHDGASTTRALILEPTRELAQQTESEIRSFIELGGNGNIKTAILYGGAPYPEQLRSLKSHPQIVVGTPGRIIDHINRHTLDISNIDYFILDEADLMLDLGFHEDIESIFANITTKPRILLFSATMSSQIRAIAENFMGEYETIEEKVVIDAPLLISQKFWITRREEKLPALIRLIDYSDDFYGLVFTRTKSDADEVSKALEQSGFSVAVLHGDIVQTQRERVLEALRTKKIRILVATDVAARGIDITGLTHVVNYSIPPDSETYIHRIGRTGRAGSAGIAITFVTMAELRKLQYLQRDIQRITKGVIIEEAIPTTDEVIAVMGENIEADLLSKMGKSAGKRFTKIAEFLFRTADDDGDKIDILARVLSVMYAGRFSTDKYGKIKAGKKLSDRGFSGREHGGGKFGHDGRHGGKHHVHTDEHPNRAKGRHFGHNDEHDTRRRSHSDRFSSKGDFSQEKRWAHRGTFKKDGDAFLADKEIHDKHSQKGRSFSKDKTSQEGAAPRKERHSHPQKSFRKGEQSFNKNNDAT